MRHSYGPVVDPLDLLLPAQHVDQLGQAVRLVHHQQPVQLADEVLRVEVGGGVEGVGLILNRQINSVVASS